MKKLTILLFFSMLSFSSVVNALTLTSSAASEGTKIPTEYTCDGKNISPALSWQGAPKGTKSFALIVADPDAPSGTFYHWVVYNIPATVSALAAGAALPMDALSGMNSAGKQGYFGPCPPPGKVHHYIFTLYALPAMLPLNTKATPEVFAEKALQMANYTLLYSH